MTPVTAAERDALLVERLRSRPPGPTIVYVTLQRTALRIAELLAGARAPGAALPRGHEGRGARRDAGLVGGLRRRRRRRDDRVRHGHRQGRRALRLPLQPAEGPRELRPGDRARRPRRRAVGLRAARLPRRRAGARELRLRRHAEPRGARRRCSASCSPARPATSSSSPSTTSRPRFDVRPLVLKTLLTYLELEGLLRQGTPFYAGYRMRPLGDVELRRALRALRRRARARSCGASSRPASRGGCGRRWRPTRSRRRSARSARASSRRSATSRIRASSSCSRPSRASATRCSRVPADREALAGEMLARFERRERAEIERIQRVLALVTADDCQVQRAGRLLRRAARRAVRPLQPLPLGPGSTLPPASPAAARRERRRARAPRRAAGRASRRSSASRASSRASCAGSRALPRRARGSRATPLYGALAAHRFADVLALCERPPPRQNAHVPRRFVPMATRWPASTQLRAGR